MPGPEAKASAGPGPARSPSSRDPRHRPTTRGEESASREREERSGPNRTQRDALNDTVRGRTIPSRRERDRDRSRRRSRRHREDRSRSRGKRHERRSKTSADRSGRPVPEPEDDPTARVQCKDCGTWVGGGRFGMQTHCESSKLHLTYLYYQRGMSWEQAKGRAHKQWSKARASVTPAREGLRLREWRPRSPENPPASKRPPAAPATTASSAKTSAKAPRETTPAARGTAAKSAPKTFKAVPVKQENDERSDETIPVDEEEQDTQEEEESEESSSEATEEKKKKDLKVNGKKKKKAPAPKTKPEKPAAQAARSAPARPSKNNQAALDLMANMYEAQAAVMRKLSDGRAA